MSLAPVIPALASALFFGLGLVLTQLGLRDVAWLPGAAISIPSSTLLLIAVAPFALSGSTPAWAALPIFVAVGLSYPGAATLLTFAANRALGPVITGTLGNLAPVFAVAIAVGVLGESIRGPQLAGLVVILAGVVILTTGRGGTTVRWRSWYLLLPLAAAAIRGLVQPAIKVGLDLWPSPFAAALTTYVISSLVVIIAARLHTGQFLAAAPLRGRLWFVAVGLCNGLAVLLLYAALAQGPVALVSPLVATYPLVTIGGSAIILGRTERSARLVFGVILTIAGVVLLLTS